MDKHAALGEKVAFYRRRRGLSQVELAALLGRSESWLSQVERGVRRVDRLSVLREVAKALRVPLAELAPLESEDEVVEHAGYLEDLRLALSGHPALRAVTGGKGEAPADDKATATQVTSLWQLVHETRYAAAGEELVRLIPDLESMRLSTTGKRRSKTFELLVEMYQAASAMLAKLGEADSAWVAADRAIRAAEQLGDALLVVAGQFRMSHAFLTAGRLDQARHVAEAGLASMGAPPEGRTPEGQSLEGALHLVLAIIAARVGDRSTVGLHLKKAGQLGEMVGEGLNAYDTEFGPTNVRVHEMACALELGDAGSALDVARAVDPSKLSPERQARFLIDVARAETQMRRAAEAVQALDRAESMAPEEVRENHRAREVVRDLLRSESGQLFPELSSMAERMGITGRP